MNASIRLYVVIHSVRHASLLSQVASFSGSHSVSHSLPAGRVPST
jgi:hypothetical protein